LTKLPFPIASDNLTDLKNSHGRMNGTATTANSTSKPSRKSSLQNSTDSNHQFEKVQGPHPKPKTEYTGALSNQGASNERFHDQDSGRSAK